MSLRLSRSPRLTANLKQAQDMDTTLVNPNFQFAMEQCYYTRTDSTNKLLLSTVIKSTLLRADNAPGEEEKHFELGAVATDRSLLVGVYNAAMSVKPGAQQLLIDMRDYLFDRGM
ncbi:unnamed protein product [Echinostoma caproni]|uniref:Carboxymuconolactone decarboxylase family protein n=1 Tax=Echinostoma caproni TaxID=27848 RepID=A0A183AZ47_9TREM|nr:unnamed protein product [Echinostoma caproni]